MVLLDNKYASVSYDETLSILNYKFKGYVPSEMLKKTLTNVIEWIKKYRPEAVINNLQDIQAVGRTDQEWIATVFASSLADSKVKYAATVLPTSVFGKLANDGVNNNIATRNQTEIESIINEQFDDEQKAFSWLEEIRKSS